MFTLRDSYVYGGGMSVMGGRVGTTNDRMRKKEEEKGHEKGIIDIQVRVGQSKQSAKIHYSTLHVRYVTAIIM